MTPQLDVALTQDLQSRGQAGASGATNWAAASQQLNRLGVSNTALGPNFFARNDLPTLLGRLVQTRPVLVGVGNANALVDTSTGKDYNHGVYGHALTAVGQDATGFWFADPNSPQAQTGGLVHYTAAGLRAARADSLVIPNQADPLLGGAGAGNQQSSIPLPGAGSGLPLPVPVIDPNAIGQAISAGISGGVGGALALPAVKQAGIVVGLTVFGVILVLLGIIVFFIGGNVAGASPATHVQNGVSTGAKVAAAAG